MTDRTAYKTLEDAIGGTPLVQLQRLPADAGTARGNVILGSSTSSAAAGTTADDARRPGPVLTGGGSRAVGHR